MMRRRGKGRTRVSALSTGRRHPARKTQLVVPAVPSTYRGVRMRSKLEARWAGILDSAALVWQYEPQVVDVGRHGLYRPDFWLPAQQTWLEVKGPHMQRIDKTRALARSLGRDGQVLLATVAGVCWRVPAGGRPSQAEAQVGRCGSCGEMAVGVPEKMGRLRCRVQGCGRWAVPERVLGW